MLNFQITKQDRWLDAMSRITWSLVKDGLSEKDAMIAIRGYQRRFPKKVSNKLIKNLELEAKGLPCVPDYLFDNQIESDFETPFIKVMNLSGEILRYEDNQGKEVPHYLWPSFSTK